MKTTFVLPLKTVASALPGIAKNIPAMTLNEQLRSPRGTIALERHGREIVWQTADNAVTFDINVVTQIEIMPTEFMGRDFVSLVLTFQASEQRLSYQFVTSNAAESDWLIQTATEIGELLEMPVENRLRTPATTM